MDYFEKLPVFDSSDCMDYDAGDGVNVVVVDSVGSFRIEFMKYQKIENILKGEEI